MKYIMMNKNKKQMKNWKYRNQTYLMELQKFIDVANNIEDESLQQRVIIQMLKCDKTLTTIAERRFFRAYQIGKKRRKKV